MGYKIADPSQPVAAVFASSPLFLAMAGQFAVCIFFVLSGFVLSLGYFKARHHVRTKRQRLLKSAGKRYFRLMIPAVGSVLLAAAVMKLGGQDMHQAAAGITDSAWLANYWNEPASWMSALRQGTFDAFVSGGSAYNSNLWTMQVELIGSLLVFGFLLLFGQWKWRVAAYVIIGLLLANGFYLSFILGMALCDLWLNRPDLKRYLKPAVLWPAGIIGVALASWHVTLNSYSSIYSGLTLPWFRETGTERLAHTVGAVLLITVILSAPAMRRFFASRPLRYLGTISFAMYLLHFIVLYSLSALLFAWLYPMTGYAGALAATLPVTLLATGLAAHYYTKWVDAPAIYVSNWLAELPGKVRKPLRRATQAMRSRLAAVREI